MAEVFFPSAFKHRVPSPLAITGSADLRGYRIDSVVFKHTASGRMKSWSASPLAVSDANPTVGFTLLTPEKTAPVPPHTFGGNPWCGEGGDDPEGGETGDGGEGDLIPPFDAPEDGDLTITLTNAGGPLPVTGTVSVTP